MEFIEQHIVKILSGLLIVIFLLFLQQCQNTHKIEILQKHNKLTNEKLDSVNMRLDNRPTTKQFEIMLKIEGLTSEKRMIQATDRKILDVNRQTKIDEELKRLQEK